jgi:hypothetical protein
MNPEVEEGKEEIQIAPMTPTELQEYRCIQELEKVFELEAYDRGDHYAGVNLPGEAILVRPKTHRDISRAEFDFRTRAARLVRMLTFKHANKLLRFNSRIWEPAVVRGWFVVFRKDAVPLNGRR